VSVHNLDKLFGPRRIAVVGAGAEPNQLGHLVLRNLVEADFGGVVYPVNPARESVGGSRPIPASPTFPMHRSWHCLHTSHRRP
jgi:acetyltransferase